MQILFTAYRPCTAIPRYFSLHLLLCFAFVSKGRVKARKVRGRVFVFVLKILVIFMSKLPFNLEFEHFEQKNFGRANVQQSSRCKLK